jgi:RNA-directed DNA polymerase
MTTNLFATMNETELSKLWDLMDWERAERNLLAFQRDIAFAAIRRDKAAITKAQFNLVCSFDAKILAVRHVADSASIAGVDNVKWTTGAEKMKAAFALTSKEYHAKPMKTVVIRPKGQPKERHIQIPVSFDRAMQCLYAFSLDPVAEVWGCRKSFGFRKGRSQLDAHAFIEAAFSGVNPPRFLVKADVQQHYGSISHDWLINNIPMDKRVLFEFLKAGHVFNGELFPAEDAGISLGTSVSPILGNMVLDGLQTAIFEGLHGKTTDIDFADGNMIRFADDSIITAQTRESAEKILEILTAFLAPRGLRLSPIKTRIYEIGEGFDFLSRNYRYVNGALYSSPSRYAVERIKENLSDLIINYCGGQKQLIERLNAKLNGWASYHKVTDAQEAFREVDVAVKALLLQLCERVSPNLPRGKLIDKYFFRLADGDYVYALENKPDIHVIRLSDTPPAEHRPVSTKKNPYIDTEYFGQRADSRALETATGKFKPVWARQGGKCYFCGKPMLVDQKKATVPIDATRIQTPCNIAYVHAHCALGEAEFINADATFDYQLDIYGLLEKMHANDTSRKTKRKFDPLIEYFRRKNDAVFTLTFADFGEIIGEELCNSAYKRPEWWRRRGEDKISVAWLSNGYVIQNLDIDGKKVVFHRSEQFGVAVKIPGIYLHGRIPHGAKAELENFFEYIGKKYGI